MNGFDMLPKLLVRARGSKRWLAVLNFTLGRIIPFNRPHGFHVVELGEDHVRTGASYKRVNHNHIRGVHACAIATVAEFSAGLLLLSRLDPARYRLIMSKLDVDYVYQAKMGITAETKMDDLTLHEQVLEPLTTDESCSIVMETQIVDATGNRIATAHTTWQIKRWDKVRTKVK
jgi:acyl-coenzyme A thioesterase PaaI-like protein